MRFVLTSSRNLQFLTHLPSILLNRIILVTFSLHILLHLKLSLEHCSRTNNGSGFAFWGYGGFGRGRGGCSREPGKFRRSVICNAKFASNLVTLLPCATMFQPMLSSICTSNFPMLAAPPCLDTSQHLLIWSTMPHPSSLTLVHPIMSPIVPKTFNQQIPFEGLEQIFKGKVWEGLPIISSGSSHFPHLSKLNVSIVLHSLLHVPFIPKSLISVSKSSKDNSVHFVFYPDHCVVKSHVNDVVLLEGSIGPGDSLN